MKRNRYILLVFCFFLLRMKTSAMPPNHIVIDADCAPVDSNGLGFTFHIESDTAKWAQVGATTAGLAFGVTGGKWRGPLPNDSPSGTQILLNASNKPAGAIQALSFDTAASGMTFTGVDVNASSFTCTIK